MHLGGDRKINRASLGKLVKGRGTVAATCGWGDARGSPVPGVGGAALAGAAVVPTRGLSMAAEVALLVVGGGTGRGSGL